MSLLRIKFQIMLNFTLCHVSEVPKYYCHCPEIQTNKANHFKEFSRAKKRRITALTICTEFWNSRPKIGISQTIVELWMLSGRRSMLYSEKNIAPEAKKHKSHSCNIEETIFLSFILFSIIWRDQIRRPLIFFLTLTV